MAFTRPRAFLFDVFGTVVDWRTHVGRALSEALAPRGVTLRWAEIADAWRSLYEPSMERVRSGSRGFVPLDVLHRENLEQLLGEREELATLQRGPRALGEQEIDELARCWHRLDPWPDAPAGIERLRETGVVAAHSNGNVSLMVDLARRGGLRWDVILGAEVVGYYKPEPQSYLRACELLDCAPSEVMMVAAHDGDLEAAAAQGLLTGYVHRPDEFGPGSGGAFRRSGKWDLEAASLTDFAAGLC